jgi:V/A-type H+-transporting ATPase subunit I
VKKVSVIVHQDYLESIIDALHQQGLMEISDISRENPDLLEETEKASMHPDAGRCTTYELRLTRVIDILQRMKKGPTGWKAMLHPVLPEVKTVQPRTAEELYTASDGVLDEIEQHILAHEDRLKALEEQQERIDEELKQVTYLKGFKLNLNDIGVSEHVLIKAGITADLPDLQKELESLELIAVYSQEFKEGKHCEWAVVIAAHLSQQETVDKTCRGNLTEFDLSRLSGSPQDAFNALNAEKKQINVEEKKIKTELRTFAEKQLSELLAIREEIHLERIRKEVSRNFAKTTTTYIINGWVLEKDADKVQSVISQTSEEHVICSFETPSENPDNPPTHLETPRWARPFRTLLQLFATPRYNEIDPTIIMGIFFVLFFGLMLGDAGYGIIIMVLSLFGYFRFGKHSEMIKNWSFLGIWLGLTTTVVGFLTNSFFGDLLPVYIYPLLFNDPIKTLYPSITLGGIQLPVEPLRNPLTILVIALLFGLIHLNIGILLAIYQSFKNKKYKSLITEHFSWILLQIGGGALIGYFLLDLWALGPIALYGSAALVIIGLILRLTHAGPLGFFDITGFVGDWLSYARLLALGLATAGMALAFNIISELFGTMIPIEIVGVIIMIILLVVLHIINLGLQALGAGVHSLRLQYVEFFNRFYEGGGREFSPFKTRRRYTKVEEIKD